MSEITIWCIVIGSEQPFPVDIGGNKAVGHLKKRIQQEKTPDLDKLAADKLKLYQLKGVEFDKSGKHLEKVREISQNLGGLDLLNEWVEISEIGDSFPKGMLHILVVPPADSMDVDAPAPRKSTESNYDEHGNPVYLAQDETETNIKQALPTITAEIKRVYSLIKERRIWLPPESVEPEIRQFYQQLRIPLFNGSPSLLLHGLDAPPNPSPLSENLFKDPGDSDLRILCNVSGSGKTRRLFEGLCQNWGFYFVAKPSSDHLGMPDLDTAIGNMENSRRWAKKVFEMKDPTDANHQNELIAKRILSKLLLARWLVLDTFIGVVMEDNQGTLPKSILYDWLLFQLRPRDTPGFMADDPFTYIVSKLQDASSSTLSNLTTQYRTRVATITKFEYFFVVIDEAQVAGETYMGAFSSSDGENERPVLRPLTGYFQPDQPKTKLIVSGTGFSLAVFTEVMGSTVSKSALPPLVDHFTGHFFERDDQLSYVARYLPPTYLDSDSGKKLKERIRRWLRGRHRFTARYLEELLARPWKGDQPASPHKFLNKFIYKMANYTPWDGDEAILAQEPNPSHSSALPFNWTKLQRDGKLLREVAFSLHTFFTRATHIMWDRGHSALVEYGIGRFVDERDEIEVEEPLVLLAITRFFETTHNTLLLDVKQHLQLNQGPGFEAVVLLTMTRLFETSVKLSDIVKFHGVKPSWADRPAQIISHGSHQLPFSIDDPFDPNSILPCRAEHPEDVTRWLENGVEGWCMPGTMMGPDLMARLLINGQKILMVIQVKCRSTGNKNKTMAASVTAHAITSLIPRRFFRSLLKAKDLTAGTRANIKRRLRGMDGAIKQFDGILRILAAYPLEANLASRSTQVKDALKADKDKHPLAVLLPTAIVNGLGAQLDGESCVEHLKRIVRSRG